MATPTETPPSQVSGGPSPGEPVLHLTPWQLFFNFAILGLSGFGGVLPFAYRMLVERKRWMSAADFAAMHAFANILPGPTICNLAVIFGQRRAGALGSIAAASGLIIPPVLIIIGLGIAYESYNDLERVRKAIGGMSAVAVGLVVSTALKIARQLPRHWIPVVFIGLAFLVMAVLRWPLIAVIGGLGPVAVYLSWRRVRNG